MLSNLYIHGVSELIGDAAPEAFAPFMDVRQLRRAEIISKNVLLCAFEALAQAGAQGQGTDGWGLSVAIGAGALTSTLKFMDSIIEEGDELSSPTAFAGSVHNSTGLTLSRFLKLYGPCVITGQLEASLAGALLTAQQFLTRRMCRRVLVAVAEDINPLLAEVLQKDPTSFDPFVYQPTLKPARVACAFVVSGEKTDTAKFCLTDISLSRTDDAAAQTVTRVAVQSCAHSALALATHIRNGVPLNWREQFAGVILSAQGGPVVFP